MDKTIKTEDFDERTEELISHENVMETLKEFNNEDSTYRGDSYGDKDDFVEGIPVNVVIQEDPLDGNLVIDGISPTPVQNVGSVQNVGPVQNIGATPFIPPQNVPLNPIPTQNVGNNPQSSPTTDPLQCMRNLIDNNMYCGEQPDPNRAKKAADAFGEVSGLNKINTEKTVDNIVNSLRGVSNINVIYFMLSWFIIIAIAIWLMVAFSWIDLISALYLQVIMFAIFYGFTIAYRVQINNYLIRIKNDIVQELDANGQIIKDSIARLPQAVLSSACAQTTEGYDYWKCNEKPPK